MSNRPENVLPFLSLYGKRSSLQVAWADIESEWLNYVVKHSLDSELNLKQIGCIGK